MSFKTAWFLLGIVCATCAALSEVPISKPEGAAATEPAKEAPAADLITKTFRIPPQTFFQASGPSNQIKKISTIPGMPPRYDVQEWLESTGMPFPAGSRAIYSPDDVTLTLINSKENLDLMEAVFQVDTVLIQGAKITLTLVDFQASKDAIFPASKMTYAEARKKSSGPWIVDGLLQFVCVSGTPVAAEAVSRNVPHPTMKTAKTSEKKPAKAGEIALFEAGESGMRAFVEPVIGPDGAIEMNLSCRYRSDSSAGGGPDDFYISSAAIVPDGHSMFVQISKLPRQPKTSGKEEMNHYRALLLTAEIVNLEQTPPNAEKPADPKAAPKSEGPPAKSK